jgi:SAM-dependent methyltransferase
MSSATANTIPSEYTFDNTTPEAATQLRLLGEILDGHTTDVLVNEVLPRLSLRPGWQGLDLGSGAGTIAVWLADRVAPDGRITALDAHPQHLPAHDAITVEQADLRTVNLPESAFDLIHARLVLMHLPDREAICHRLAASLRPGGILLLSEWDCRNPERLLLHTPVPGGQEAFDAFQRALLRLAVANGADLGWAGRVPLTLQACGLTDIHSVVHNQLWTGGQAGCLLHASNSFQLAARLTAAGVRPEQLVTLRQAMVDPETLAYSYPMFTTLGRRPEHDPTTGSATGVHEKGPSWSASTP